MRCAHGKRMCPTIYVTGCGSASAQLQTRRQQKPELIQVAVQMGTAKQLGSRMGDDGVEVARFALRQDSDVLAYAGARALILAGTASDGDDVVRLLQGKMPGLSAPLTLEFLVANDPVRGNAELLAKLLRHDSGPVRRTAKRELRAPRRSHRTRSELIGQLSSPPVLP